VWNMPCLIKSDIFCFFPCGFWFNNILF
jgi:hypothetical protein